MRSFYKSDSKNKYLTIFVNQCTRIWIYANFRFGLILYCFCLYGLCKKSNSEVKLSRAVTLEAKKNIQYDTSTVKGINKNNSNTQELTLFLRDIHHHYLLMT